MLSKQGAVIADTALRGAARSRRPGFIEEEAYAKLQYELGLQFLERRIKIYALRAAVETSRAFWNWWAAEWALRDLAFRVAIVDTALSVHSLTRFYQEFHGDFNAVLPHAVYMDGYHILKELHGSHMKLKDIMAREEVPYVA